MEPSVYLAILVHGQSRNGEWAPEEEEEEAWSYCEPREQEWGVAEDERRGCSSRYLRQHGRDLRSLVETRQRLRRAMGSEASEVSGDALNRLSCGSCDRG